MIITANALELKIDFLFEKCNKLYVGVLRMSIAEEKSILDQEHFWSGTATVPAEKGGALL